MTTDHALVPERETLSAMEQSLAGMMTRLQALVDQSALSQDELVEIIAIYNNVAYLFLYLEANERHINFTALLPWRDAFHNDPDLDQAMVHRLRDLHCIDPEAEKSRLLFLAKLERKRDGSQQRGEVKLDALNDLAKSVLEKLRQDQQDVLGRLGVNQRGTAPEAAFYRIVSSVADAAKREKLTAVWTALRDRHQDELIRIVDRMIGEMREQSRARGYRTVLEETLLDCRVSEAQAAEFLDRYMVEAISRYQDLKNEIISVLGPSRDPIDHFGRYIRTIIGPGKIPHLSLEGCLGFVSEVIYRVFGLTLKRAPISDSGVLAITVWADDVEVGAINCDLWDSDHKALRANHTKGIRNRTDWSGIVQKPVAYVSCRFQRTCDGTEQITFQNAHSLLHEFGHAVNHLLIRKRISNQSGLDYLPRERLEYLSMWFEKWVFHPSLDDHLRLAPDEREGMDISRRIKKLEYRRTYLDRAVTASLDFELHRQASGGLADAFQRLDDRYGIGAHCELREFPAYFTWPMLQANPGADFSYLWGAAESAQQFADFQDVQLERVEAVPRLKDRFASCFDFDLLTEPPAVDAAFSFYDSTA